MSEINIYEDFKNNFLKCLREEHSGRTVLINRCTSAFVNAKTNQKKLLILIGQTMFEDGNNWNGEIILNDKKATELILKLFNDSFKNKSIFEDFEQKYYNITKAIKFFYEISKLYTNLVSKDKLFHEILISLIFKSKYEKDKNDYVNSIINIVSSKKKGKYQYNELLNLIDKHYIETNDFISEFVKIFLDNESKYIIEIREKLILKELKTKKILNKNNESLNNQEIIKIKNAKSLPNIDIEKNKLDIKKGINIKKNNIKKQSTKLAEESEKSNNLINENKSLSNSFLSSMNNSERKEATSTSEKRAIADLKQNLITVKDYLNEQYNKYKKNGFEPCSLKRILDKNKIEKSDISYVCLLNKKKIKFYPDNKINDTILNVLINKLKFEKGFPDVSQFGYFCYKINKNKIYEALYSTIDSELLYKFIIKPNKAKNYNYPDEEIKNTYLDSRAKSLEYFINKTVFQKKYGNKLYPKIIFPLQSVYKIKKNEYKLDKSDYIPEIKIDGCFFCEKNFVIQKDEFPFESQYFKPCFYNMNLDAINYNSGYMFFPNDLCLIEVKTHFPVNKKGDYIANEKEKDLFEIVIEMLNKMIIYEQLFQELNLTYNRIRMILFYDVVKKEKYENVLQKALRKFRKDNELNYLNKVYFQIIYMESNYLAESLKSFEDKIDHLEYKYNQVSAELIQEKNKREELEKKINEIEEIILLMSENMNEEMKKKIMEKMNK